MENEEILSDDVAAKSPKLIDENKLSKSGTSVVADGGIYCLFIMIVCIIQLGK